MVLGSHRRRSRGHTQAGDAIERQAVDGGSGVLGLEHRGLAAPNYLFGAAHRGRRIHGQDLSCHQPVEQLADGGDKQWLMVST